MNISDISNNMTKLNIGTGLILVTPLSVVGYQPKNPANLEVDQAESIIFQYEAENVVTLESDVTDHYIENNSAIQDHVALKPEQITVSGYVGELSDFIISNSVIANKLQSAAKQATDKLVALGAFQPELSISALRAYNQALYGVNTLINSYNTATTSFSNLSNMNNPAANQNVISSNGLSTTSNQNNQQTMFTKFYQYYWQRRLFQVQTPWAIFDNCVIKSLRAVQDAETATVTNFEVTFKMLRFAKTTLSTSVGGRLKQQASALFNNGTQIPTQAAESFASKL